MISAGGSAALRGESSWPSIIQRPAAVDWVVPRHLPQKPSTATLFRTAVVASTVSCSTGVLSRAVVVATGAAECCFHPSTTNPPGGILLHLVPLPSGAMTSPGSAAPLEPRLALALAGSAVGRRRLRARSAAPLCCGSRPALAGSATGRRRLRAVSAAAPTGNHPILRGPPLHGGAARSMHAVADLQGAMGAQAPLPLKMNGYP